MSLSLQNQEVASLIKKPTFKQLIISQDAAGRMSVDGTYSVDLVDAEGNIVTNLESISFGVSHEQLVANPNFATSYPVIRELARSGLESVKPKFVVKS
jgi:hypothetical protein